MRSSVARSARPVRLLVGALALLLLGPVPDAAANGRKASGRATGVQPAASGKPAADRPPSSAAPVEARPAEVRPGASDAVALFEFRTDSQALGDLPERLASALRQNTSLQVIDLAEARRRIGPGIDAEVARCAGETTCLSRVGERLGAREVLLLAVSQLGDVVLALQRIHVPEQKVAARFADSLGADKPVDEARVMGWLQQLYPPETFKRYGQIHITTDVQGAQVYVNAKARGQTPLAAPLQVLAPGSYRLLVEKDRYLPFQATLSVMPDTTVEVTALLQSEQRPTPWHRRWYVWFGLSAGVVAVAATGAALKLGLDVPPPDMTRVPGAVVFR